MLTCWFDVGLMLVYLGTSDLQSFGSTILDQLESLQGETKLHMSSAGQI